MLKNDGRKSNSKASKKKHKLKQVKCGKCKNITEYHESDIESVSGMKVILCDFCGIEINLK